MSTLNSEIPEITVSMPAYNTGMYIADAIRSVLDQQGVSLELIVVDDCSTDNTTEIVKSFNDPRLRLICNEEQRGIGYCHNVVLNESKSPFISHVDSDDFIMPGALKTIIDEMKKDLTIGQVHCYFFPVNENGLASRDDFRRRKKNYLNICEPEINYREKLLQSGWVINHLRTYRREIFDKVGGFNEEIKFGIDYEMSLRIIDKSKIKLVPEILYLYRKHQSNTTRFDAFKKLRMYLQKKRILWSLIRSNKINFITKRDVTFLVAGDIYYYFQRLIFKYYKRFSSRALFYAGKPGQILKNQYKTLVPHFGWWPISLGLRNKFSTSNTEQKIAYYLWKFPVLSQTFVQREVIALLKNGIDLTVYAEAKDKDLTNAFIDSKLIEHVEYVLPQDHKLLRKYLIYFLLRKPLNSINLLIYVICRQHSNKKNISNDISVYLRAIYLAGKLKHKSIKHIHSPWANQQAFVALIASKLLGIRFSVQARAYDIHRESQKAGIKEIFENAEVVVTNTEYNKEYISSIIADNDKDKIKRIYNGLNLEQFQPNGNRDKRDLIRILSVGRLVEQKGFEYLIKACHILRSNNVNFRCDIIGEAVNPDYTNYCLILKKLCRELGLENHVFFLGGKPFKDVLDYYKMSDIVVLPCVIATDGSRDIIPNIVLESMAMKLPVVSTTITGVPELVVDGVTGFLVPDHDEHALASAIDKLIKDKNLRDSFGEKARERIENRFNINKNISEYVDIFNNFLN